MATLDEIYNERLNLLDNPPKANPIGQPILPEAGVQSGVTYTLNETTNQIVPVQEGVGTGIQLPGRKLMAEDEFFKVADSEGDVGVVGNVLSGIGKGVVQGAQEAGTQIGDTLTSGYWSSTIAPMLRENVPGLDAANQFAQENLQPEGQVQEVTASIASPLSQILVPGALATRAIRAAGVGSRILAETFGYSAAEVAAVSPETTTLMEMGLEAIDNDPQVQSLIEKAFAVQMDENDFMMRLKNLPRKVIEGGVTGVIAERAFEGIGMFYRAMKNSPTLKAAAARYAEGKSPVPVGMSIEDVSPSKAEREMAVVEQVATTPEQAQNAVDVISRIRSNYPTGTSKDKFVPIEVTGGKYNKKGVFIPVVKKIAYKFAAPKGTDPKKWRTKISTAMVNDVEKIVERAKAGDRAAVDILAEARWYRDMRVRLRAEFGGMGDIFADLLGTTSAQTDVKANWANAVEIIRRFSRGEFDTEIAAWNARSASGKSMSPVTLQQMHKGGEFPLITNASGALFNANSPASMKALLDTFRDIKAGVAPKTPNFTGNLIGYSDAATVDVWAGRYLRNKSGQPYIPPPAEQAVGGQHGAGSTFDEPRITGDFGVGQDIFAEAARKLNKRGSIQAFNPAVGDIGADDLQAIVWFMEKEKWTKNGWTSKSGEGGSLDFEASVAGASDPARMEMLRSEATKTFKAPAKRKTESPEDYNLRVQDAMSEHIARTVNASAAVGEDAAPLDRTVLGLAGERPGKRPSNYEQAEMAAEIDDVLRNDQQVVAYKATNTYGNFAGVNERAIDGEIITRQGFDPTALEDRIVKLGIEKDQDAVFTSKVIQAGTPEQIAAANPGMELYFVKKQSTDFAADLAEKLRQSGIDGFTFVTDARQADRIDVQAVAGGADTAGITGLRVQYIPEFNSDHTPEAMQEASNIYYELVEEYSQKGYISSANVVHYETKVFRRDTDTDWMSGGTTYGEHTGTRPGNSGAAFGQGQLRSQNATQPDRGTGQREISP